MEASVSIRILRTQECRPYVALPRSGERDARATLEVAKDGSMGASRSEGRVTFSVGSGRDCDLVVTEPGWEQRHVTFAWHRRFSTWVIENCSRAIVYVQSQMLRPGESRPLLAWHAAIQSEGVILDFIRKPAAPIFSGADVVKVPLTSKGLMIGRGPTNKDGSDTPRLELDSEMRTISSAQAQIIQRAGEYFLVNLNAGSEDRTILNGDQNFDERKLVLGDCIKIPNCDYYTFKFTGRELRHLGRGGVLQGVGLCVDVRTGRILHDVSVDLHKGDFVGIIGGSGQGKSTLMNALCGIVPATSGRVVVDGGVLRSPKEVALAGIGYVPQDDIVHADLTVRQALGYAARLRLKASERQIEDVIDSTMEALRLTEHRDKRIANLSGGQRKRVSIASELLVSPDYLFLDEPTSGLDPQTETLLMGELSEFAQRRRMGVACTTHVLQNCHVLTSIAFISRGRLIFCGEPVQAVRFFLFSGSPEGAARQRESLGASSVEHHTTYSTSASGSQSSFADVSHDYSEAELLGRISKIYDISQDTTKAKEEQDAVASAWESEFKKSAAYTPPHKSEAEKTSGTIEPRSASVGALRGLRLLFSRQLRLLLASKLSCMFLAAQALVIGGLVGWVSDNPVLQMFLCLIAALWFGCSNGAQQIIGEFAIFRRERLAGLGIHTYLLSKFLFFSALTSLQAAVLFFTVLVTDHALHHHPAKDLEEAVADFTGKVPDKATREFRMAFFDTGGQWKALASGDDGHEGAGGVGFERPVGADGTPRSDNKTATPKSTTDDFAIVGLEVDDNNKALPPEPWTIHVSPTGLHPKDVQYQLLEKLSWFFGVRENMLRLLSVRPVRVSSQDEVRIAKLSEGTRSWQLVLVTLVGLRLAAFFAAAVVGVALGLTVSSLVNTPTQAVMWVPLILIPQILFGAFVVVVPEMDDSVLTFSRMLPSFNLERMMDVAMIYGRPLPSMTNQTKIPGFLTNPPDNEEKVEWDGRQTLYDRISDVNKAWQNLTVVRSRIGKRAKVTVEGRPDQYVSSVERRTDVEIQDNVIATKGEAYLIIGPAQQSAAILAFWALGCYAVACISLYRRQTGR